MLREERLDFGVPEAAADVVPPHPDAMREAVDVRPAQCKQVALAHAGHRGREVEHAIDAAGHVVEIACVGFEAVEVDRRGLGDRQVGPDRFPGQARPDFGVCASLGSQSSTISAAWRSCVGSPEIMIVVTNESSHASRS
jgi:hypothetical protein